MCQQSQLVQPCLGKAVNMLDKSESKVRQTGRKGPQDNIGVTKRQPQLKRQRNGDDLKKRKSNQARVPAFVHDITSRSPTQLPLQNATNCIDIEKRLSPNPSKRLDECSSPPAKIPLSSSPTYAGAKFSDPPSPKMLPKPPTHWMTGGNVLVQSCFEMTNVIKVMLKVQA